MYGCSGESDSGGSVDAETLPYRVSLHRLVFEPEVFDGREISTVGVAVPTEFDRSQLQLYLTKDDARHLIHPNSIWVDLRGAEKEIGADTLAGLFGKYVVVEGTFHIEGRSSIVKSIEGLRILDPLPLDESRYEPPAD